MRWFAASLVASTSFTCFAADKAAPAPASPHEHHAAPGAAAVAPGGPITSLDRKPPAGYEKVDVTVTIGVVPGQMKYDKAEFTVRPGAKVKITLVNTDIMQHNLVVCKSEKNAAMTVANAALALGADGFAKGFIPESELIMASTKLLDPYHSQSIYLTAPKESGGYPYVCTMPGHAFTMTGVMFVGTGSFDGVSKNHGGADDMVYKLYLGKFDKLPDFTKLVPQKVGPAGKGLTTNPKGSHKTDYAFVWTGKFFAPIDDDYTFYLSSDDGSRILIDDKTVIDNDGAHDDAKDLSKTVRLTAGDHDLEVQYFQASGPEKLYVAYSSTYLAKKALTSGDKSGKDDSQFEITVKDKPVVKRSVMPDATTRSVAVGLPGGTSYCFDGQVGYVLYGWTGKFINTGPELGNGTGRGGGTNRILGTRFSIGATKAFPLRIGDSQTEPVVHTRGYTTAGPVPRFMLTVEGYDVTETIEPVPGKKGLVLTFEFDQAPGIPVSYLIDTKGLTVTTPDGTVQSGRVLIAPQMSKKFSITIVDPAK